MSSAQPKMFPTYRLLLLAILLILLLFTFGCLRRQSPRLLTRTQSNSSIDEPPQASRININTASADELETLPGIGKALAGRIIEHRERFGPFRKPEHLIIVRGISDKRFRAVQNMITVE